MDCRSCKKCTELYIDGLLPQNLIVAYTDHLASCPECTEDLHINYAILTALRQLNEGQDLSDNFATEVDNKLKVARFKIRREAIPPLLTPHSALPNNSQCPRRSRRGHICQRIPVSS